MKKINIKKMLGVVGLLAVAVPATFSVVACGTRTEVKKIDLNTLILTTIISGEAKQTKEDAFQSFLDINKNIADLEDSVEIKEGSFDSATYVDDGSLIITAKKDNKYTGEVKITIEKLGQTNINSLKIKTIAGEGIDTQEAALDAFLKANDIIDLNEVDTTLSNFEQATTKKSGKLTITITTENIKYTGSVEITIDVLKIQLNSVLKNTIVQSDTTEANVISRVLSNNPNSNVIEADLGIKSFTPAQLGTPGLAILEAQVNSKFTGEVEITIISLPDAELVEIINNIKNTPPKTQASVDFWKEYFNYYSETRIQYLFKMMNLKFEVNKDSSQKEVELRNQMWTQASNFFDWIIVVRDGLLDYRYDNFFYNGVTSKNFDETNRSITITINVGFSWYSQNDIKRPIIIEKSVNVEINFSII